MPRWVVYHLVPTSNHNCKTAQVITEAVVYHLVPTSNHNRAGNIQRSTGVVYHLVPTSNHNLCATLMLINPLFIILFLHQTTTDYALTLGNLCCLSSCSYIKPQLRRWEEAQRWSCLSSCSYIKPQPGRTLALEQSVVYHLVPTSNHNKKEKWKIALKLFIILFLHQTTTLGWY